VVGGYVVESYTPSRGLPQTREGAEPIAYHSEQKPGGYMHLYSSRLAKARQVPTEWASLQRG